MVVQELEDKHVQYQYQGALITLPDSLQVPGEGKLHTAFWSLSSKEQRGKESVTDTICFTLNFSPEWIFLKQWISSKQLCLKGI